MSSSNNEKKNGVPQRYIDLFVEHDESGSDTDAETSSEVEIDYNSPESDIELENSSIPIERGGVQPNRERTPIPEFVMIGPDASRYYEEDSPKKLTLSEERKHFGVRSIRGSRQPIVERFGPGEEFPARILQWCMRLKKARLERRVAMATSGDINKKVPKNMKHQWERMGNYSGTRETFISDTADSSAIVTDPYEAFRYYWDDEILSHIVKETNRFARTSSSFNKNWYSTNVDEILTLFAFWIMLGIIRVPDINLCYDSFIGPKVFRSLFRKERYLQLNKALRLAHSSLKHPNDPLHSVRHVMEYMNAKFKDNYVLKQEIIIDESVELWGRPDDEQLLNIYRVCDSSTGYLWNCVVLCANEKTTHNASIERLLIPLLNKGHIIYMDNWFTSPSLALYMKRNQTDSVGALRKNVPCELKKAPLFKGEYIARRSENVTVLVTSTATPIYGDMERVAYISTCHDITQVRTKASPEFPLRYNFTLVNDFNQGMEGADRLDHLVEMSETGQTKGCKWKHRFLKRLLSVSIENAIIVVEQCTKPKIEQSLAYRTCLAEAILNKHLPKVPRPPRVR